MIDEIKKLVELYRRFLSKRKQQLTLQQSDSDSNSEEERGEAQAQAQENSDFESEEEGSEAQAQTQEDSDFESEKFSVINEELELLNGILVSIPQSKLNIRDPEIYSEELADSLLSHEIDRFRNKLLLTSHNKISHLSISSYKPLPYAILDYIRNNYQLKTVDIDTKFFSLEFILDEEFVLALNSAPNLIYLGISVAKEPYDRYLDAEEILESLSSKLEPKRAIVIELRDGEGEFVFIKKPNDSNVLFYDPRNDHEITLEDFLLKISSRESYELNLILQGVFANIIKPREQYLYADSLINETAAAVSEKQVFDGWNLLQYAALHDDVLSACYLITNGIDPCWTSGDGENSLTIAAQYASVDMLRTLLKIPLPMPGGNIQLNEANIKILEKTNVANETPLFIAVKSGKINNVDFLIRCGANLKTKNSSIQVAVIKEKWDCVLSLLKAGSFFPAGFNLDTIPLEQQGVRDFVENCIIIRSIIEKNLADDLRLRIDSGEITPDFRDLDNHSAPYIAFSSKNYEIYALLRTRGFKIFEHESLEIEFLSEDDRKKIKKMMTKYITKPNFSTVIYLLSRSRVLQSDPRHFEFIRQVYEDLTSIPEIQLILKVLEFSSILLDIIFDFESDNVQDISPTERKSVKGLCNYKEGKMYIGAKVDRLELLGVIAHEFTHQAMQILFQNDCNPYPNNSPDLFEKVKKLTVDLKDQTELDPIISKVFTVYEEEAWHAEIIVRVPHMLAKYGAIPGKNLLENQANELLEFYKTHIETKGNAFISNEKASVNLQNLETRLFPDSTTALGTSSSSQSLLWRFDYKYALGFGAVAAVGAYCILKNRSFR
jgi:hypothetical protein